MIKKNNLENDLKKVINESEDLEVIKKNNLGNDNKNLKKVINEKLKNLKEIENLEGSEVSDKDFFSNDAFKNEINKKNDTKERYI